MPDLTLTAENATTKKRLTFFLGVPFLLQGCAVILKKSCKNRVRLILCHAKPLLLLGFIELWCRRGVPVQILTGVAKSAAFCFFATNTE
jgi:hypothetical protein